MKSPTPETKVLELNFDGQLLLFTTIEMILPVVAVVYSNSYLKGFTST